MGFFERPSTMGSGSKDGVLGREKEGQPPRKRFWQKSIWYTKSLGFGLKDGEQCGELDWLVLWGVTAEALGGARRTALALHQAASPSAHPSGVTSEEMSQDRTPLLHLAGDAPHARSPPPASWCLVAALP